MLSNTTSATPRPRPPAKARRLPSVQFPSFPPPPYAASPSLEQVLAAANAVTEPPLTSGDSRPSLPPSGDTEEWVNEQSREELSELLVKAEELIRSRETGEQLDDTRP